MPGLIEVDLRPLDAAIKRMSKSGTDLRPAWRKLRGAMRKDQRDHMKAMEGPSGASWPPLAAATRAKRMRKIGRAGNFTKKGKLRKKAQRRLDRILSGRLLTRAKVKIMRQQMSLTSQVRWAGVHNSGGAVGRGARVPRRTFLWISDELLTVVARTFESHMIDAWKKKAGG